MMFIRALCVMWNYLSSNAISATATVPSYGEGVAKALELSLAEALIAEDQATHRGDWK